MKLAIEWEDPVLLRSGRREGLIYVVDSEQILRVPGIYVFARRWGDGFEALYVGKSKNVRSRVKGHFNNLRLMRHLEEAKNGRRVVIVGYPVTKPGQRMEKVLTLLERGLIRHFLSEGHDLVNQQGTRLRRHSIESSGIPKAFVPTLMYLERSRGD